MTEGVPPLRSYRTAVTDSSRWEHFAHRPGNIFVCTPPKCGTTWMQTIIMSLIWPTGDAPAPVMELSPWLEAKFNDLGEIQARLAAQQHRRVIKSHTPADGIPIFDRRSRRVRGPRRSRRIYVMRSSSREVQRRCPPHDEPAGPG